MKSVGVFDILGPIMVGPSSSHTAGAARLGKIARAVAGGDIKKVIFLLHGSFAKTYKGHGTDRALAAGILGMEPSDLRLRNALDIAEDEGIYWCISNTSNFSYGCTRSSITSYSTII